MHHQKYCQVIPVISDGTVYSQQKVDLFCNGRKMLVIKDWARSQVPAAAMAVNQLFVLICC
jgi:hypothetical protein